MSEQPEQSERILYRVTPLAWRKELRNRIVQVTGHRGRTAWDMPRMIIRVVESDGSLGDEYLVSPGILNRL